LANASRNAGVGAQKLKLKIPNLMC